MAKRTKRGTEQYAKRFCINKGLEAVLDEDVFSIDTTDDTDDFKENYVIDLFGKVHYATDEKVETVRKSMDYWKDKQDTQQGERYYKNMRYLYQQLLLFMEGTRAVS